MKFSSGSRLGPPSSSLERSREPSLAWKDGSLAANGHAKLGGPRVVLYSPGMVGLGHIRRNASIAHALRCSPLRPNVVMVAEAWQAGAIPMPSGVDCVTLPGMQKNGDGSCRPRSLEVSHRDLVSLRGEMIRRLIEVFEPNALIVDHLPLGAARELQGTLERVRRSGKTRCILGVRDVLQDNETVQAAWADGDNLNAIRQYYDAIWVYGDPAVIDPVKEYGVFDSVLDRVRHTGYLDQRLRLDFAVSNGDAPALNLPAGPIALCLVGGGSDGGALAQAFVQADLPWGTTGLIVTGPYMPEATTRSLHEIAGHRGFQVLDFVPDPVLLLDRAERVVAMGGYNTMCEVLSFEKHALIVPRVLPKPEQWIRARRMRDLGLVEVLHPEQLTPAAITEWLARDLGAPPASRRRIDMAGLQRIPLFLAELLGAAAPAIGPKTNGDIHVHADPNRPAVRAG